MVTTPYVQPYTARIMVNFALKNASLLGVGQTALTEDINDAFRLMNGMLGVWSRKRWLIWHLLDVSVTTNTTQQSYTIGDTGDYDVPRPDRLEFAYFSQFVNSPGNRIDYPLRILQSMEDYAQIALKDLKAWPQVIFYDSAFPLGTIYPVPVPQVPNSELHVVIKDTLNQFADIDDDVSLPPEYFEAIWSNLAIRIAATFPGAHVNENTVGIAKAALATIRGANAQIPRLRMPTGLVRPPLYNIFSGQIY